ncbi:MAG: folylpolyglutamate synthase/dihydrofolate synthase family protein [Acidimicrobiia bacterium]|nr:MAG: folylpolyglutamate synthase/dihydrofolate synthase family protein [Acidimicrobiia bacterium]
MKWRQNSSSSNVNSRSWAEPVTQETAPVIRNREEAEAFLDKRIGRGVQPGLERITGLLAFMDDPQRAYPSIHIAGTNGKTTVSRMIQQILGAHGLATGGFTSPHLERVEERFTIHGVALDSHDFTDAVGDIAWFVVGYETSNGTEVTYFEVTAALAFSIFATATVDVAVIEVGLGGRLDATNVLDAAVSVITGIDIDHTEYLGTSIAAITAEKAAILKELGTIVTGALPTDALDVVAGRVADTGGNWIRAGRDFSVTDAQLAIGGWHASVAGVFAEYQDLFLPIHGRHQVDNLATSLATAEMFLGRALDPNLVQVAVAATSAPGRLEIVGRQPVVILDGAHNAQGFRGLAATLDTELPTMSWQLVLGARGQRSVASIVAPLRGLVGHVFATAAGDPSSIDARVVADEAADALGVPADPYPDVPTALVAAKDAAGSSGGVVVAGSLYVVGEARREVDWPPDKSAEAHMRFEAERIDDVSEETEPYDLPDE